jgi:protocatechuate 3,4-dioxygenase beta subunit
MRSRSGWSGHRANISTAGPVCLGMDRRNFLATLLAAPPLARLVAAPRQDLEFLRAVERAQKTRPHILGATARIAPAAEPGTPLVIHGRAFQRDGLTPAVGIVVFAYHTDATGRYDVPEAGAHSWRLRGWVKTATAGRFEFTTIRPAPYPSGRTAAHVHLMIERPEGRWQAAGILFDGDNLISAAEREESARAGRFGSLRPVDVRDGVQHLNIDLRILD